MDNFVLMLIIVIVAIYLGLILMVYAAQFLHGSNDNEKTIIDFPECEQENDSL